MCAAPSSTTSRGAAIVAIAAVAIGLAIGAYQQPAGAASISAARAQTVCTDPKSCPQPGQQDRAAAVLVHIAQGTVVGSGPSPSGPSG